MKNRAASMKVTICMGSSCFARGNNRNLELLEEYIEKHGLAADVRLSGSRCEGLCADGPNVVIDGTLYSGVNEIMLRSLLDDLLPAPLKG